MPESSRASFDGVIRVAEGADAEAVAAVHCRSAVAAYAGIFPADAPKPTPELLLPSWESRLGHPAATVLVAEVSERVVGVASLAPDDGVPTGMLLERLYVDPASWGSGAGSALHLRVLELARYGGASAINLWVLEGNDRARRMYERWGWHLVPDRYLPNADPTILDVLYQRDLPPA